MSDQTDTINLLKPFGLSSDEGRVYLYLLEHGYTSALNLNRQTGLSRTKIYRIIDKLKHLQLTETKLDSRGTKFGATSPIKFTQILSQRKSQLNQLETSMPQIMSLLSSLNSNSQTNSKVLYYQGLEGLKQVSYNLTKANKLIRVFEIEHLSEFLPPDYSEMIRRKLVENKIVTHDLTNKTHLQDFTQVSEMITSYSEYRHIPPSDLDIQFEVLIYNDVYATYTYKDESIFCVEIYNPQLAHMQKQIFDFIWSQAKPMKFTSPFGSAQLKRT